jgi:hypothetical protein
VDGEVCSDTSYPRLVVGQVLRIHAKPPCPPHSPVVVGAR